MLDFVEGAQVSLGAPTELHGQVTIGGDAAINFSGMASTSTPGAPSSRDPRRDSAGVDGLETNWRDDPDLADGDNTDWITAAVDDPTDPGIRRTPASQAGPGSDSPPSGPHPDSSASKQNEKHKSKSKGKDKNEDKVSRRERKSEGTPPRQRSEPNPVERRRKVPRSQRPPRWGGRILPKSILGISLLMLAAGIGAATAGTALYMNYQFRRDQSDALVKNFDARAKNAVDTVQAEGVNARRRIQDEIEPIRKIAATGDTLRELLSKTEKAIWQVNTVDVDGGTTVGTAFVVASDSERSFLVTSYAIIRASTARPGPGIKVRKGAETLDAELWTWQESKDLALLIVKKPSLPRLDWGLTKDLRVGQQVFAVSAVGTAGGSITQGFLADVSKDGLQHTAALGTFFQGGPLLSDRGLVVGIASRTFSPYGFPSDGVWFATQIRSTCAELLKCPAAEVSGAGQVTGTGNQR